MLRSVGFAMRRLGRSLGTLLGVIGAVARAVGGSVKRLAAVVGHAVRTVWRRIVSPIKSAARFSFRALRRIGEGVAAAGRAVGKPGRQAAAAIARAIAGVARRAAAGMRVTASRAHAALEPVIAFGGRARLAASTLVRRTPSSARQLVAQTRQVLRGAVRWSSRRGR
jgi:hypothetical protein